MEAIVDLLPPEAQRAAHARPTRSWPAPTRRARRRPAPSTRPTAARAPTESQARRPLHEGGELLRGEDAVALGQELGHLAPVDVVDEHHADGVRPPAGAEERAAGAAQRVELVAGRRGTSRRSPVRPSESTLTTCAKLRRRTSHRRPAQLCSSYVSGRPRQIARSSSTTALGNVGVLGHSKIEPPTSSRMRSAWPLCLAYSSIMWTSTQRTRHAPRGAALRPTSSSVRPSAIARARSHSSSHAARSSANESVVGDLEVAFGVRLVVVAGRGVLAGEDPRGTSCARPRPCGGRGRAGSSATSAPAAPAASGRRGPRTSGRSVTAVVLEPRLEHRTLVGDHRSVDSTVKSSGSTTASTVTPSTVAASCGFA